MLRVLKAWVMKLMTLSQSALLMLLLLSMRKMMSWEALHGSRAVWTEIQSINSWGQSSIVNHQSLIVNHHSSIINRQSSIVNRQSSIVNRQSSIVNHQSSIVNHQSSILIHQSSIVNRQSPIIHHDSTDSKNLDVPKAPMLRTIFVVYREMILISENRSTFTQRGDQTSCRPSRQLQEATANNFHVISAILKEMERNDRQKWGSIMRQK